MNLINSLSLDPTYQSSITKQVVENVSAPTEIGASSVPEVKEESDIRISTRAQKIQKLGEEFFPSGPQSIEISPDFVERLHEYGLITDEDLEKLSNGGKSNKDAPPSSLENLIEFTQDFEEELKLNNPESSLIGTLQKARDVMQDFTQNGSYSNTDINVVTSELMEFAASNEYAALSTSNQKSLSELEDVMTVAKSLNQEKSASAKINSYVEILETK